MTSNKQKSRKILPLRWHRQQQSAIPVLRYKYNKSSGVPPTTCTAIQPNFLQNKRPIDATDCIKCDYHNEIGKTTKFMREYEHDEDVQLYGCERLAKILYHDRYAPIENVNIRKVVKVILKCITTFTNSFGIQYNGCLVLEILSSNKNNCIPIKSKEMEVIINHMSQQCYTDLQYGFMPKLKRVDICRFGCWALAAFSTSTQGVIDMARYSTIIATLTTTMRRRKYDITIQQNASKALSNLLSLTCESTTVAQDILKHGGIEAIIDTMDNNQIDLVIQLYGCRLMKDLVQNDKKSILFIKKCNGVKVIKHAMRKHEDNGDIQHYGRFVLFYDKESTSS